MEPEPSPRITKTRAFSEADALASIFDEDEREESRLPGGRLRWGAKKTRKKREKAEGEEGRREAGRRAWTATAEETTAAATTTTTTVTASEITAATTTTTATTTATATTTIASETPKMARAQMSSRASSRAQTSRSSSPVAPTRKRKRAAADAAAAVPLERQVLRGMRFFYIPDDDVAPKRRLRITRARTYGAEWTRAMADATHVVVDENLRWADVETFIGQRAAGRKEEDEPLVVVTEEYPMDCIQLRRVLPSDQARYRVRGGPSVVGGGEAGESGKVGDTGKSDKEATEGGKKVKEDKHKEKRRRTRAATPPRSQSPESRREDGLEVAEVEQAGGGSVGGREADGQSPADQEASTELAARTTGGTSAAPQETVAKATPKASAQPSDELSEYIELTKKYDHLPLDDEDGEDHNDDGATVGGRDDGGDSTDDTNSETSSAPPPSPPKPPQHKERRPPEHFACQTGGTVAGRAGDAANPNARTIQVLQEMCDYYARTNDQWRTLGYRRAISTLRRQTTARIATRAQARALHGIGDRLADKIEEIAATDGLRRLESVKADGRGGAAEALALFLGVFGVGTVVASRWVAQGLRSLEEVVECVGGTGGLSENQRVGIERYKDLNTRIPREEVERLVGVVQAAAAQIEPAVEVAVSGSYRRGAESSGDVDFLITREGTRTTAELVPFLETLVARLTGDGVLVHALISTLDEADAQRNRSQKWFGCAVVPPSTTWRRVDFLLVPATERGAAMLYFTGNDVFNRSMRLLASRKGMRLNQHGLFGGVMRGPGRKKLNEGELLEARDERRIFEILGVQWREPWERWC